MNEIREGTALGHAMLEAYCYVSLSYEDLHGTSSLEGYLNVMQDIRKYATEFYVSLRCYYLQCSLQIYSSTSIENLRDSSQLI
jgi:hypothetical protein